MAERSLPTVGMSPIDVYNTQLIPGAYFQHVVDLDSTERHNVEVVSTATFASGESHVGLNIVENAAGTAGAWMSGIFVNAVQDSTKRINGYLCAGEFQLSNAADNASAMSVLTLNWVNTSSSPGAPGGSTQAYIQLRDYSSGTPCSALFEFTDITVGSADATSLICEMGSATTASHVIRITVKNTPYWILMDSTPPA